ncbi:MAG: hypothetical protein QF415_02705 [Candidatus Undinarchaeales archaeon]|jgi:hypothetical protein|nr:hypothetical protein [Candidatus Undinarchaeales archaeon]MDP7492734.1 hypothetical protein [Candidatus Undinarchaeales archaeon]
MALWPNQKRIEYATVLHPDEETILVDIKREPLDGFPRPLSLKGLQLNAEVPLKRWRLSYTGELMAFKNEDFPPHPLRLLLSRKKMVPVSFELAFDGINPCFHFGHHLYTDGGQLLSEVDPDFWGDIGLDHIEQSGVVTGEITLDGDARKIEGFGERDHSWGVRDFLFVDRYRLFTMFFSKDFTIQCSRLEKGSTNIYTGFVYKDGVNHPVTHVNVETTYDHRGLHKQVDLDIGYGSHTLKVQGDVKRISRIPPLREHNPLKLLFKPYPLVLHDGYTVFTCGDRTGYGLAEYCNVVPDPRRSARR